MKQINGWNEPHFRAFSSIFFANIRLSAKRLRQALLISYRTHFGVPFRWLSGQLQHEGQLIRRSIVIFPFQLYGTRDNGEGFVQYYSACGWMWYFCVVVCVSMFRIGNFYGSEFIFRRLLISDELRLIVQGLEHEGKSHSFILHISVACTFVCVCVVLIWFHVHMFCCFFFVCLHFCSWSYHSITFSRESRSQAVRVFTSSLWTLWRSCSALKKIYRWFSTIKNPEFWHNPTIE